MVKREKKNFSSFFNSIINYIERLNRRTKTMNEGQRASYMHHRPWCIKTPFKNNNGEEVGVGAWIFGANCRVQVVHYSNIKRGRAQYGFHWPVIIKKSPPRPLVGARVAWTSCRVVKGSLARSRVHKGDISRVLTFIYLYACQMPKVGWN